MMDWLQVAFLGIIQGLTEFLPVSSTGHLFLGRKLFGLAEAGLFLDTMLHLGTLIAVIVVYWKDLLALARRPFSRLTGLLLVGTIPAVVLGLLFKDFFEELSKTGITIGWEFLITGVVLWFADNMKRRGYKMLEQISYVDALIIGIGQGAAILPAVSRSGMTIAAALFRKIEKETATYFSFLLSIPVLAGAIALQVLDMFEGKPEPVSLPALAIGIVCAGVFGYLAIRGMIAILKRRSLKVFAIYVWILGVGILILQALGKF